MRKSPCLAVLLLAAAVSAVRAEVRMPPLFGDHMVLQQDLKLPVFGTAAPGEKITVQIAGHAAGATAGTDGKWIVRLDPLPVTREGADLIVTGTNRLTFHDVLIGDVWLASGQSNMEFGIDYTFDSAQNIAASGNAQIRLFTVAHRLSFTPVDEYTGKWIVCTPDDLKKENFAAVAYYFAKEIQEARRIPIGIVGSYWGGSSLQAWTSAEALRANPAFANHLARVEKAAASLPELKEKYDKEIFPAFEAADAAWKAGYGAAQDAAVARWKIDSKAAHDAGQPVPPRPTPPKPAPTKPRFEGENNQLATVLYNGMLAPLIPYGIKGVIWYQGESNVGASKEYSLMFPAMIGDWRQRWGQGNFPFLFVQLPGWGGGNESMPPLRDAQAQTLATPNTAMAVTLDIGDKVDLHPKNKRDVGHRLALAARQSVYGEPVVGTGPLFDHKQKEGGKVRVFFRSVGGGLVIGSNPTGQAAVPPPPPADHLEGFEVAGADGKFVPARAVIDGGTVLVSAEGIAEPASVQYGWKAFPTVNLYNKEGLPAAPFQAK